MQREHPAALIVVRIMLILAECVIYGVPDGPLILPLGVREFAHDAEPHHVLLIFVSTLRQEVQRTRQRAPPALLVHRAVA